LLEERHIFKITITSKPVSLGRMTEDDS